jgi:hypothetical protein
MFHSIIINPSKGNQDSRAYFKLEMVITGSSKNITNPIQMDDVGGICTLLLLRSCVFKISCNTKTQHFLDAKGLMEEAY